MEAGGGMAQDSQKGKRGTRVSVRGQRQLQTQKLEKKEKQNSHGASQSDGKGCACPRVATQAAERRGASGRHEIPGGMEKKK
jgi:hypothetical protein